MFDVWEGLIAIRDDAVHGFSSGLDLNDIKTHIMDLSSYFESL